jgi:hypothetical protein
MTRSGRRRPFDVTAGWPICYSPPVMRFLGNVASALAALIALSGCSTDLSSAVMPGVHLPDSHRAYVICNPQEDAGICALIATDLQKHGLTATYGTGAERPEDADVLATYEDRWTWDIVPYLLTLRIDLRDPQTNVLLATARTYRTSLARKTPATMVGEVVDALFTSRGQR